MYPIIDYFNLHNEVKCFFAIVEDRSSEKLLSDLCFVLDLDLLVIFSSNSKLAKHIQSSIEKKMSLFDGRKTEIKVSDYDAIHKKVIPAEPDAIYFDAKTDLNKLFLFSSLKINYFSGTIEKGNLPYFLIWEQFRKVCNHIYIQYSDSKTEYINWDSLSNPIELSVVFPVYNVEKYLKQCIESVTKWKADYVEFLFINDGSPDNSRDVILEYQKKDPRIQLIDKENGGCASARKYGLEHAKGKYIGFVDPDDFVDEEMFKTLFARVLLGSYEVCYCGYNEYYENTGKSKQIEDAIFIPYSSGTTDPELIRQLTVFCRVAIWRMIYRADFLKKNGITFQPEFRRFDDLPFKFEVFSSARSVVAIPQYLYYYRLQRPGQDVSCDDERLYVHFSIYNYLDTIIGQRKDRQLLDYLFISKVQTHSFAIEKIQRKYLHIYLKKARKDIGHDVSFFRGAVLTRKYLGWSGCFQYIFIETGLIALCKNKVAKHRQKAQLQSSRMREKLKTMYTDSNSIK